MRNLLLSIAAVATLALAAAPASAKTFKIVFKNEGSLRAACSSAGGNFSSGQTSYGCWKTCSGTSICSVDCNRAQGTCTGTTPGRVQDMHVITSIVTGGSVAATPKASKPGSVFGTGILESGPGFHSQGPAASGSPMAPSTAPSAPPIVIR